MQENDMVTFAAEADDLGKRIDVFAAENYEELSRSGIKKIIDSGNVLVNGKAVKANYKLRNGDVVTLIVPQIEPLEILPQNIPLDILYEDDDVIVINKPQGMVVHPAPGHYTDTMVNALLYHCGDSLSAINGALRPGIVDPTRRYPAVPSAVFVTPMPKVVPSYTSIAPRRTRASLGRLDTRIRDSSSRSLL